MTCSEDNTVRVWDASDYSVCAKASVNAVSGAGIAHPTSVAMSVEAIFSGWTDGEIRSHAAESGAPLFSIQDAHLGGVNDVKLSANERFVISGGEQGEVRVWELRSRDLVSHLKGTWRYNPYHTMTETFND